MALPLIIGAVAVAAYYAAPSIARSIKLERMTPEQRESFLLAEAIYKRLRENEEREQQYLNAIKEPCKWCLMAMREGRNYTRQWVDLKDVGDVSAWARANGISVTEMHIKEDEGKVKLSLGDLRKARGRARLMGEPV